MAVVLYRRLSRVVLQSAVISNSKWAWSKPPVQLGRNYLSISAAACSRYNGPDLTDLAPPESLVGYDSVKYIRKKTDKWEENEVHCLDDFIKSVKNFPNRAQSFYESKSFGLNLDDQEPTSSENGINTNRSFDHLEVHDTKNDPRCFQQHRPEYTSMCFSLECPVETSIEESVCILNKDHSSLTPSELSECLIKLSRLPKKAVVAIKSNEQLRNLYQLSTSNVSLYTNAEIVSIICALARLHFYTKRPIPIEYKEEICLRVWQLSTNDLLLVADTFRLMDLKVSKFLDIMYNCMELRYLDLSLPQVIQLIYIIGEARYAPPDLLEKVDAMVLRYISTINVEEIGATCLGFFKSQNGLSKALMMQIGNILVGRIEQISNYSLVSVLKMFRFTRVDHTEFFVKVGEEASKRMPEMSVQSIMHVVLAFASLHIRNEKLMHAAAMVIPERLHYCRCKDVAKYLWSFGMLNYKPVNPNFYSAFIGEIHRNLWEFMQHPQHFLTCLMGLSFSQQFPLDLINIALSRTFVEKASRIRRFELTKDIFTIAGSVEIECPQYKGNTISVELRKNVEAMILEVSSQDFHTMDIVYEIGSFLQQILGGPEYVKEHMILPHTRTRDFEVHLDINRKPVPFTSVSERYDQSTLQLRNIEITDDLLRQLTKASKVTPTSSKKNCQDEEQEHVAGESTTNCSQGKDRDAAGQTVVTKLAIQVTNRNQYLYHSKELLGFHALKLRQLRKLGYVVVEVPFWEWLPLRKRTLTEQLTYLHRKVFNSF